MNGTLYTRRFDSVTSCDVTEDFTLPDYQPEVRRVVGVRGTAAADGKYLSGDELEADGGVTYTVLYIGEDGGLYQTSQTSSYTGHIPAKSEDDRFSAGDIVLSCTAENVNCRVTAPRKITLSSRVKIAVMSQKPVSAELKAEGKVRRRTETHKCAYISEERHSAEVSGEMHDREGMRLIMASGELCVSDVRVSEGKALVKGDAYVSAVLLSPEGAYVTARGRAPIEEEINLSDRQGGDCTAAAFAYPVMLEVEGTDDGAIKWRMEYDIDCDVMNCGMAEVTVDAYLTDGEDIITAAEHEAYYPAATVNGRLTTSAAVKQRAGMNPVCAWGNGSVDKCEISSGRMTMSGNVKICIAMMGEGDSHLEEVLIPLKYECEAGYGAPDTEDSSLARRTMVAVTDIQTRGDGETLNITAELAVSAVALGSRKISCVQSVAPVAGGGEIRKNNVIRIYMPDEGESSWDVEKRFRLDGEAQREGNLYII